jgi:hypothetical protein
MILAQQITISHIPWNPDTGERLDIEGIVVDDPRVNEQLFNRYLDIAVDSKGNAHIFFDQKLRFEIEPYQMETDEVCWARVDDYSTGEYTSRILSTFYTDGYNDAGPSGTVNDDNNIHVI